MCAEDGQRYRRLFPSRRPTGRADALLLTSWFEKRLSKLRNQETGTEDPKEFDDLLSKTLEEIARQISVQCVERGQLMLQCYGLQKQLCSRLLHENQSHAEEFSKLHKKISDLEAMRASLEKQVENLVMAVEFKKDEIHMNDTLQRKREMDFLKKQVGLKSQVDYLERKLHDTVQTHQTQLREEKEKFELEAELAIEEMERKLQDILENSKAQELQIEHLKNEKRDLEHRVQEAVAIKEHLETMINEMNSENGATLSGEEVEELKKKRLEAEDLIKNMLEAKRKEDQQKLILEQEREQELARAVAEATAAAQQAALQMISQASRKRNDDSSSDEEDVDELFSEDSNVVRIQRRQKQRKLIQKSVKRWVEYVKAIREGKIRPLRSTAMQCGASASIDQEIHVTPYIIKSDIALLLDGDPTQTALSAWPRDREIQTDPVDFDEGQKMGRRSGPYQYGKMIFVGGKKKLDRSHSDPELLGAGVKYFLDRPHTLNDLRGDPNAEAPKGIVIRINRSSQTWTKYDTKPTQTANEMADSAVQSSVYMFNEEIQANIQPERDDQAVQYDSDLEDGDERLGVPGIGWEAKEAVREAFSEISNAAPDIPLPSARFRYNTPRDFHSAANSAASSARKRQVDSSVGTSDHPALVKQDTCLCCGYAPEYDLDGRLLPVPKMRPRSTSPEENGEPRRLSLFSVSTSAKAMQFGARRSSEAGTPGFDRDMNRSPDGSDGGHGSRFDVSQGWRDASRRMRGSFLVDSDDDYIGPTDPRRLMKYVSRNHETVTEDVEPNTITLEIKKDNRIKVAATNLRILLQDSKSMGSLIVLLSLRKLILQTLDERIRILKTDPAVSLIPAAQFVHDYLSQRYGLKAIAQKHMKNLVRSLDHFKEQDLLSYLFGRFCGLFEPIPLPAFNFVVLVLWVLQSNGALTILAQMQRDHQFVPTARIENIVTTHFTKNFPEMSDANLLRRIQDTCVQKQTTTTHIHIDNLICALVEFWYETMHMTDSANAQNSTSDAETRTLPTIFESSNPLLDISTPSPSPPPTRSHQPLITTTENDHSQKSATNASTFFFQSTALLAPKSRQARSSSVWKTPQSNESSLES
eukprot:TRINITY_DN3131_c0_g1_i1.p1 TRINITY_DN3131_c0_g1~~TRINITY_DN3131_c0_g1_i1.p1  ORF type:complete len:1094 (+),score=211.77 TRINITY_DN3131_c0_g1_i1:1023-4304(+)